MPRLLCAALLVTVALAPRDARACGMALLLAMDVSGSVDASEYRLQVDGLAAALRDPDVTEALLTQRAAVSVVQWSGVEEQELSIPWTRLSEPAEIDALAVQVEEMRRAFRLGNTGVGAAISFSTAQFDDVPDCVLWVMDVSGDGDENVGFTVGTARRAAIGRGIIINGLAIEGPGTGRSITNFYRNWVVTPGGFVETAENHHDFARAIRYKLLRELVAPVSSLPHNPYRHF
jgi:Ca-activated chloride channel homolog